MHADQVDAIGTLAAPVADRSRSNAYDPRKFASWAEARVAYPYHGLILSIDPAAGRHYVEPVFPMPDGFDLYLEGCIVVRPGTDHDVYTLADIEDAIRQAGPYIPRR